ncbi:hypothetical protein [Staphylococcus edaphicus]|nr:hypothetical protein [Staphylococcus edaphicus]
MKQRLSLAICLVSEPKLAIMDEPFVGLDPNGVNTLIKSLKEWAIKKGMTVLISSHQLNELEEICNRFTILKHGTLKEANLGQEKYLKISVKEKILEEDEKQLTLKFKTIQNISEASIYLNSESKEMSDIINYMLPKYSLDSTETIGDNLYDYFNEGDC